MLVMKTTSKYILGLCAVLLGLSSCTEKIDLELDEQKFQRLVVDGWVTNEAQKHRVKLSLTTSFFDKESVPVATGATVTISDGSTTWPLVEETPGNYYTAATAQGEVGKTYTLNVDYEGELYTASSYLRPVPQIDSVSYFLNTEEPDDPFYELYLYTEEPDGIGDYYMWRVSNNGEALRDSLREIVYVEDTFVDGNYITAWNFDNIDAVIGDSIKVDQMSITKDAYETFNAILLETEFRGGLFDSPPANVQTNVSNGALGFFGTSAVSSYSFVIN